jgi:hypothetical protein
VTRSIRAAGGRVGGGATIPCAASSQTVSAGLMPAAISAAGSPSTRAGTATGAPFCQPCMLQEAGDAADGVGGALAQVDAVVAVEIDGIVALAARHELRDAHGAGVGALDVERADAVFARQQQELLEFAAEKFGARRVIEGQRGERFEDAGNCPCCCPYSVSTPMMATMISGGTP